MAADKEKRNKPSIKQLFLLQQKISSTDASVAPADESFNNAKRVDHTKFVIFSVFLFLFMIPDSAIEN